MAHTPVWLWPNLLSLDAPMIAAVWQSLFARDAGVQLSIASRVVLPMSVWLIYLTDRLLDTARGGNTNFSARHRFSCDNRPLCVVLAACAAVCALVSAFHLPRPVFQNGLAVLILVIAYLFAVHGLGGSLRHWLPKEAAVGLIFSIGSVLAPMTWSAHSERLVFPALLFGILCWANSAAIESWEGGCVDGVSSWTVRHLKTVSIGVCCLCLIEDVWVSAGRSSAALLLAALGYCVVDYLRPNLESDLLRVSIDIPLLAPLLLLCRR